MFSVAVIIPFNKDTQTHDIDLVSDDGDAVRTSILNCDVYAGTHVVAATVLRWDNVLDQCPNARVPAGAWPWDSVLKACRRTSMTWLDVKNECPNSVKVGQADHAEFRTLKRFKTFVTELSNRKNLNRNDLLLFYVQSSPCPSRCTREPVSGRTDLSILSLIGQITNWNNYAVVFSKVFQPRSGPKIPEPKLRDSLERLGRNIGLGNIFRCDGQQTRCTSCLSDNQVTPYCYSENAQPPVIRPRPGSSPSPSGSGGRRSRPNSVHSNTGAATNADTNAGQDQAGSGSKAKRKRNRVRRRKRPGNAGSLAQNELVTRETNDGDDVGEAQAQTQGQAQGKGHFGKARRVGGRRVGKKKTGSKNNQKSKRSNNARKKNVKKRDRGEAQWGQGPQQEWPIRKQPRRQNSNMWSGDKRRINQPWQRRSGSRG